ncbi:hypothetical protein JIN85_19420 [Luteolibacter pohnpeiensis]|uniref:GRAM domain-containing protein n=1 Tax=Luteolibacter pohnpeiensis TaxID=454153 RepID=A0A934SAU7_9BACT|nr:hypothetical protein [Luteolibacter pohnpeiensis]MBK1884595.1 hypothetical protein [Luteolibacter pohnpeiensis]
MPQPVMQSFRNWMKVALVTGMLYGISMGVFFSLMSGRWYMGLPTGILAGLIFGPTFSWLMRVFTKRQIAKFQVDTPGFGSETLLMEGPANHFKGVEAVGGYLWVTDARVHFSSHSFNIQNHTWTVLISDIQKVTPVKTLGTIDNGLRISTTKGDVRFVVNNSRGWAELIQKHISTHPLTH